MHRLVLFIHRQSGPAGQCLLEAIHFHFPDIPRDRCTSLGKLRELLRHPVSIENPILYVLFADTRDRLRQLQTLQEHLENRRMILILPDNQRTTRSQGLRLLPRYVTYADNRFNDLVAVIGKIIGSSIEKSPDREIANGSKSRGDNLKNAQSKA